MLTRAIQLLVGSAHAIVAWLNATLLPDDAPMAAVIRRTTAEKISILLGRDVEDVERGVVVRLDDDRQWVLSLEQAVFSADEIRRVQVGVFGASEEVGRGLHAVR